MRHFWPEFVFLAACFPTTRQLGDAHRIGPAIWPAFGCCECWPGKGGGFIFSRSCRVRPDSPMGSRLNALRIFAARGKPLWTCIGGVAAAVILAVLKPNAYGEMRVIYVGFWLQMFGLISIARGFSQRQRAFRLKPVRERILAWLALLRRFIRPGATQIIGAAAVRVGAATATGRMSARITPGPNATTDQRVDALWRNFENFENEIGERMQETDSRVGSIKQALDNEARTRQSEHAALAAELRDLAVGDLDAEIVGFVWLVLSTVATTIPGVVLSAAGLVRAWLRG